MLTGPENENLIPEVLRQSEPRKKLQNDRMLSAFWEELLENGGALSNEEINIKLYNYRLGLDMAVPYLIVLFCVKYREGMSLRNEENLVQCIFRWKNTGFFRTSIALSGIVVPMERTMTVDMVIKQCEEYIHFLEDAWKYKLAVFVGTPLYMDKLTGHFNELMVMALGTVSAAPKVYRYETAVSGSDPYVPPNLELWRLMLEKGSYDKLYGDIESYLRREMPAMHRHYLNRFMHDFEQMLNRFMSEMDIYLTLLMDDLEEMIYVNRYDSVEMVGYHNFAHFSTAFRRFSGVSPVAFRQTAVQEKVNR